MESTVCGQKPQADVWLSVSVSLLADLGDPQLFDATSPAQLHT